MQYGLIRCICMLSQQGDNGMIISVVNNKGGVGKTCCASNLAHALSLRGVKVLLVDNDPQSNSTSLMLGAGANPELSLYHVYRDSIPITQAIYTTPYGANVVPNSNRTDTLELELYQKPAVSYFMLRNALREHALKNYDLTLIDCPPTLGLWVVQALITSDACKKPQIDWGAHLDNVFGNIPSSITTTPESTPPIPITPSITPHITQSNI